MGRYIKINEDNQIIGIRRGNQITKGEVESDTGKIGQVMQSDGSIIDSTKDTEEKTTITLEDKVNYLYYKAMGVI